MVGVDRPNRAVAVDVVAGEEEVVEAEGELAVGVAGGVPDLEPARADLERVAVTDRPIDLHRRHLEMDVLRRDLGKRLDPVAALERLDRQGMGDDRSLEERLRLGQPLDVIDVGMRSDQPPAGREGEVELADHLHDLVDGLGVADVDEHPVAVVINEIDVATDPPARLVVHLDDTGENRAALEHRKSGFAGRCLRPDRPQHTLESRGRGSHHRSVAVPRRAATSPAAAAPQSVAPAPEEAPPWPPSPTIPPHLPGRLPRRGMWLGRGASVNCAMSLTASGGSLLSWGRRRQTGPSGMGNCSASSGRR